MRTVLRGSVVRWVVVAALAAAWLALGAGRSWADDKKPAPAKPPAAKPAPKKPPVPKAAPKKPAAPKAAPKKPVATKPAPKPAPKKPAPPKEPPKPLLTFHNEGLIEKANGDIVYFYRTNFVAPKSLIDATKAMGMQKLAGVRQQQVVPGSTNQVMLEGDPDAVEMLLDLFAYFDVAQPQVFIEAKVIEVTYDSNFEIGLDYLHDRDVGGPNTLFRGAGAVLNPPSFLRSGFAPSFPFQGSQAAFGFPLGGAKQLKFGAFEVNFQALQINGKAEILSKPSIIATQGVKAIVSTEEQTPIVALNFADRNNEQFRSATVKTGVKLEVTPKHIGDQFVTLQIMPEVKGAAGLAATRPGGTFAPIQTTRSADTTVTLGDKETLVIGGLYTNQKTTEKAKTPFLSDIPILGEIFTRTKETKQKTELIFILTPHIVRKTKELKIVVPPKELERLEAADAGKDEGCGCGKPLPMPKPCLPKPPGWGAQLEDD